MYRLERVEIAGFKSFYDKVDLAFPGRVTAVVGPNGCGKSNICDAVAWALGEQSARVLRGERMDDVIFNGSARRRPVGMAEVTLTLTRRGNGHGNGHGEAAEDGEAGDENGAGNEPRSLRIGRRVYREGQGEYFLNDRQVRLKDIQDELSGTGLGVRAYSVIEQGRIDQVLSTKPQDRRRLIEEAAGITRYKMKKRLAETKLEETRGNLLRLSDIISEIERNVASLKRQASRAARYKEQSEALREKRSALLRARHDRLSEALARAARERDERRDREAEASAKLARAEADLASARLAAAEAVEARDRIRESVAALEAAIERDEALIESNRRAAADLAARRESLARESREYSGEQERTRRELVELEERLERAIAEARSRSSDREDADRKATAAGAALAGLEQHVDAARADLLAASGEKIAARNARHDIDLAAERAAASLARLEASAAKVSHDLAQRTDEVSAAESERSRLAADASASAEALARSEAELARISSALEDVESGRDAVRRRRDALESRIAALAELARDREQSLEKLRAVLTSAGIETRGTLGSRLHARSEWEDAVDEALGADADALVAATDAARALAVAGDFPGARLVLANWTGAPDSDDDPRGWRSVLENFGALSPPERAALPPAAFVATLAEAEDGARRTPGRVFVTLGRQILRGPFVRAARSDTAIGLAGLTRERERLDRDLAAAEAGAASAETRVVEARTERDRALSELPARRDAERRQAAVVSAFDARLEERRAERDRLRRESEALAAEAAMLRQEAAALAERRTGVDLEETRCGQLEAEIQSRLDGMTSELPEARSFAAAAADELAHRRTEAEVAAERRRSVEGAREKLAEAVSNLDRRLVEARAEEERLAARGAELVLEERNARARQASNLASRSEGSGRLAQASDAAAAAAAGIAAAEEETKGRRAELDASREARFESEVAHTRVASDLEHLQGEARAEFAKDASELTAPPDVSEEAIAALEREAADLQASIERMGPVNVLAYEEHQEETKRLTFLTTQRDDLLRSIAELQESIRKINATSSERFREAFAAINRNFHEVFLRLFQGGAAEMRLLDETDLLESGIEIVAQPPGKRNQSILLLSGGEKALTAIALLIAIFRYKPSPFCILDEVDAPLDEANIDRFTRLLKEMTEDTQFIAITHNKRTMETADAMYGVTMEEPGCSKIVSVRFD